MGCLLSGEGERGGRKWGIKAPRLALDFGVVQSSWRGLPPLPTINPSACLPSHQPAPCAPFPCPLPAGLPIDHAPRGLAVLGSGSWGQGGSMGRCHWKGVGWERGESAAGGPKQNSYLPCLVQPSPDGTHGHSPGDHQI